MVNNRYELNSHELGVLGMVENILKKEYGLFNETGGCEERFIR